MEIAELEERHVVEALRKHPIGISNDGIWSNTTCFTDRHELSLVLHRMSQQGTIYKTGTLYYLTPLDVPSSEQPAQETIAIEIQKPPKIVDPLVERKLGDLPRRKTLGSVAMVLWKYRKEDYYLSVSKIKSASGIELVYSALSNLVERGYILRSGSGRETCYKWSDKFKYPFSSMSDADLKMVLVPPRSEVVAQAINDPVPVQETPATIEQKTPEPYLVNEPAKNPSLCLSVLDAKISVMTSHLESLKHVRTLLLKELGQ